MKRLSIMTKILIVLILLLTSISCDALLNQEATLNVTNKSNHIQNCILNGGNIATLDPGGTKSRTIQPGSYVIYFTRQNNTICCSAAYFEAKAGQTYGYSCSN